MYELYTCMMYKITYVYTHVWVLMYVCSNKLWRSVHERIDQ
jgi:hypothetical protein